LNDVQLTAKELEALALIAQGHDAKSASRVLEVSPQTVYERLRRAREELGASNSREAARAFFGNVDERDEYLVAQKFVVSDAALHGAFASSSGSEDGQAGLADAEATTKVGSRCSGHYASLPLRSLDERVVHVGKSDRLRMIGELSMRLAVVFAAVCLTAMIVSTILQRG